MSQGGYRPAVPASILKEIIEQLKKYKEDNKLSKTRLSTIIGCTVGTMTRWLSGESRPRLSAIKSMIDKGVVHVTLPDELQKKAVQQKLIEADRKNDIPRKYVRRANIPALVENQIKLLLDDYVEGLNKPRTFDEFCKNRSAFIYKLYYICSQVE